MISKKLVAASILAAMGTSAHAIGFKAGEWEMDLSGSVNAYYNTTSCDNAGAVASGALGLCGGAGTGQDQTSIQTNRVLLPLDLYSTKYMSIYHDASGTELMNHVEKSTLRKSDILECQ